MEEGYPGNLEVTITYFLTNDDELEIDYSALTDTKTVINLTQHSYFNLRGEGDILDHEVKLNASSYIPVDSTLIPTGALSGVTGTPFDFLNAKKVGLDIESDQQQMVYGGGFDHCWVIDGREGEINPAATVYEPTSGRVMEVFTTEPGVQFYTGNFLDGTAIGKEKRVYKKRSGLCLETQHFPDSPNQPSFPTTTLEAGENYHSKTVFKFSTRK